MESKKWIINWFSKNSILSNNDISTNLSSNYLEKNWIDSLKFISLITDIENNFKIKFSNEEFENEKFQTLKGLIEIIDGKTNV